jgi:phospholipase C
MARINHFIVLMLENRSFDHMFGFFPPPAGEKIENVLALNSPPVNLLDPDNPESASNPAFQISQQAPFAVDDKDGPSHSFNSVNVQLTNDKRGPSASSPIENNGFARNYADELKPHFRVVDREHIQQVMQCFAPDQLPALNQLAREFCLCDHWHCEVPGPTMPNRMFVHAATSEGYVHNDFKRPFTSKTVYELFEEKGLTWAAYFSDLTDLFQFEKLERTPDHFRRFDSWADDVAAGKLPNYTFLFPRFMNGKAKDGSALFANSQHAPEDVRFGDHFIADVYEPLAANPELFQQSALVITYDEHGGFYDHIKPGPAPNPDGQNSPNPDDRATFKLPFFAFDRIGLRVPAIVISPWIAKGSIEHRMLQHTSIIKTVCEIFDLNGPLNRRDQSAQSFGDLFEKANQPRSTDEMPKKLDRAPIEDNVESVVAGVPMNPADEPLDELTKDWSAGMLSLLGSGLESVEPEEVPTTQGQAADAVQASLKAAGL